MLWMPTSVLPSSTLATRISKHACSSFVLALPMVNHPQQLLSPQMFILTRIKLLALQDHRGQAPCSSLPEILLTLPRGALPQEKGLLVGCRALTPHPSLPTPLSARSIARAHQVCSANPHLSRTNRCVRGTTSLLEGPLRVAALRRHLAAPSMDNTLSRPSLKCQVTSRRLKAAVLLTPAMLVQPRPRQTQPVLPRTVSHTPTGRLPSERIIVRELLAVPTTAKCPRPSRPTPSISPCILLTRKRLPKALLLRAGLRRRLLLINERSRVPAPQGLNACVSGKKRGR